MAAGRRNAQLNGHAPTIGPIKTLERMAEALEEKARAVRITIDILAGHRTRTKHETAAATLDGAIQLDRARAAGRAPTKTDGSVAGVWKRRAATAAFLALFDAHTPRPQPPGLGAGGKGLGTLIKNGYLKRRGKGYVRTAKPFLVGDEVTPMAK